MKLARKLTIALVAAVCAVLVVHGVLTARRELAFFETDRRREAHEMGRALAAVVNEVRRTQGDARAFSVVNEANARDSTVTFRWVWLDSFPEPLSPELATGLAAGQEVVLRRHVRDDDRILTYVPLQGEGRAAALEVVSSFTLARQYVGRSTLAIAITTAIAALLAALLTMLLGAWFVGRPVRALASKARRVGEGDLGTPLVLAQRDELGELATEMNAMCDRLAEEREARQRAVDELRHAHRLATVGRLASGIAHELGTPLHVVAGWTKMIAKREIEGEQAVEAARNAASAADRIAVIIRQLLDFARRAPAKKEVVDLRVVVDRTLELLAPLLDKRKVRVGVEGEHAQAAVDPAQLQQALTNLIVNGADAMHEGGELRITIDRLHAKPPLDIGGEEREWVRIQVIDEGHGIAAADMDQIFEPFFTTKDVGEGTGLGLSVTYGIVREHDGFIGVDSKRGHGATFAVHLPAVGGAA